MQPNDRDSSVVTELKEKLYLLGKETKKYYEAD